MYLYLVLFLLSTPWCGCTTVYHSVLFRRVSAQKSGWVRRAGDRSELLPIFPNLPDNDDENYHVNVIKYLLCIRHCFKNFTSPRVPSPLLPCATISASWTSYTTTTPLNMLTVTFHSLYKHSDRCPWSDKPFLLIR